MAKDRPPRKKQSFPRDEEDEDEEDSKGSGWKAWARDILIAAVIMAVILGGVYLYTGNWPPLVVVESGSMQHADHTSYIGVIDTGDLVFVQHVNGRGDIITYIEGRVNSYQTYGEYGDVIIFSLPQDPTATPIIHRAIMYVERDPAGGADIPDLSNLPPSEWEGVTMQGQATNYPYNLKDVTIQHMGFNHDLIIQFDVERFVGSYGRAGYITMGDHNAYDPVGGCTPNIPCSGGYDTGWFPAQGDIIGRARGEIPWFGLLKLLLSPAPTCCSYWGDSRAPLNSWDSLLIALVVIVTMPFILEAAAWAWSKYAWPWVKPRLPWKKAKPEPEGDGSGPEESEGPPPDEDEPR